MTILNRAVLVVMTAFWRLFLSTDGQAADKDWKLVFVAKSGVTYPDPYTLWSLESFGSLNAEIPDAMDVAGDYPGLYKSRLISKWELLNITEVKMVLYSKDNQELTSFLFDGTNTDIFSWFMAGKLKSISPGMEYVGSDPTTDLSSLVVSLHGSDNNPPTERFVIKGASLDDCNDIGLVTMVTGDGGCRWQSAKGLPFIVYSTRQRQATWPSWIVDDNAECYTQSNGQDYRGTTSVTETGKSCQNWTSQTPHTHNRTPDRYPDDGLGDHNYCRNPLVDRSRAWCFTTDPEQRFEYCDIGDVRRGCGRYFDCEIFGPNWVYWNSSCYLLQEEPMTWENASIQCSESHSQADLTVVNSIEENNFTFGLLPEGTYSAWLGCRDVEDNGIWICLDDSGDDTHQFVETNRLSSGFWNWDIGQPNDQRENCLVLGDQWNLQSSKWHDWPCSNTFQSICEIPVSEFTTDDNEIGFAHSLGIFIKYPHTEPISCPADITITNEEARVTWEEPTPDANTRLHSRSHEPGDVFPLGVSEVTYTFIDQRTEEISFCSFFVSVTDILNDMNSDQLAVSDTPLTVAVILGIVLLIVIVLFVAYFVFMCVRIKTAEGHRPSGQPSVNYYMTPIGEGNEPRLNGHTNTLPTRALPSVEASPANSLPSNGYDGEDTYEELKDRPPSGAYTGLGLNSVPRNRSQHPYETPKQYLNNGSQHSYEIPKQYANI